jgi:hypothetical protein
MRWKELVSQAFRERTTSPDPAYPRFEPGATEANLRDGERRIGVTIPEDLRSLLAECDGIMEVMEIQGQAIDTQWLIWPTDMIVERNLHPGRAGIGLPESWLIFATADGSDFGYDQQDAGGHIWVWQPIDDKSRCVATSLLAFLRRWITGELRL